MRMLYLSLLAFMTSVSAYAGRDTVTTTMTSAQISNGAIIQVNGSRYLNPLPANKAFWVERSYGLLVLSYPLDGSTTTRPIGNASITVNVQYQVEENGVFFTKNTSALLKLDLQSSTASNTAYLKIEGAQQMSATLANVNVPSSGWSSLTLAAQVITESFSLLEKNAITATTLVHDQVLTTDGNLKINWTAITGAETYELEWTYVSDQGTDVGVRLAPSDIEIDRYLFRNNSSRVEVTGLTYSIPMIYEKGIILYRLRALGQNLVNSVPVPGKSEWSAPDGMYATAGEYPQANIFIYDGLEQNINWQSSLSFAEEGKHKVVTSFHDGSLRNRQAVTRINSDQRAIVGETLYDYNGRPVIQVLPVPVTQNDITYYPNFNLVEGQTQMKKENYDALHEGNSCQVISPLLSNTTGASQYYSSTNPFGINGNTGANLLNRDLIPDAQKFPYTQTFYTPDNTGRIAFQSGVGITHKIGSGKETRYLYGSPQQPELTRLFGNQVGFAGHYKKNAVIDPNGQVSVSYLDLDGKVVATALAGTNPGNLDALTQEGDNTRSVKSNLLANPVANKLSLDLLSKTFSTKFTVTGSNTPYKFTYHAQVGSYGLSCIRHSSSNPLNYNIDGVVNVQFNLQDKCGNTVFNSLQNTAKGNTGSIQNVDILNDNTLEPGEYQLSKSIKIDEEKLEEYWQEYLAQEGTCVLTEQDFQTEEVGKLNIIGCGVTCEQCQSQVNAIINGNALLTTDDIATLNSACDNVCSDLGITCLSALEAMRGDLSPGGQYGQLRKEKVTNAAPPDVTFDPNNLPAESKLDVSLTSTDGSGMNDAENPDDDQIDPSNFPVSIFNENNRMYMAAYLDPLNLSRPSWRTPLQVSHPSFSGENRKNEVLFQNGIDMTSGLTYSVTDYKDVNGDIFYVNIYKLDDNGAVTYKPEIDLSNPNTLSQLIAVDEENALYKIPVRYLLNLADFEKYWQTHWANYLLPYHPEFQYYQQCTADHASNDFDYAMINAITVDLATQMGLIKSDGTPDIIGGASGTQADSKDPFIANNKLYYLFMKGRNDSYQEIEENGVSAMRTMAQTVTIMENCPRGQSNCGAPACADGVIDTDEEWAIYRSLYLAEKQKLQRNKAIHASVDGSYYNGCVGHKDYLSNPEAEYFRHPITNITPVTRTYQDCHKNFLGIRFNWFCHTVSYTTYTHSTTYPYLNPGQLCYVGRAADYEMKTQHFYPTISSGVAGVGEPAANCTSVTVDPNDETNILTISIPCDADLEVASQSMIDDAQRFKYTTCGLCPLGSDVEQFLMNINANQLWTPASNLLISCDLPQYNLTLGEVLRREIFAAPDPDLPASSEIYWSSSLSMDGKEFTGTFLNGSNTLATISLKIPASVSATYATLVKLCCLSILTSGQNSFYTFDEGKNFSIQSSYIGTDNSIVEFIIEGKISFALSPCTIAPRCLLSEDANHAATFLNILATETTTGKQNDLNTNSSNLALDQNDPNNLALNNIDFYNFPVKAILKKDDKDSPTYLNGDISVLHPVWNSFVTADVLSGVLSYTDNGPKQVPIEISGLPVTYQYSQVSEFINLQPQDIDMTSSDPCRTANCVKTTFKANAVIMQGTTKIIVPVIISVPTLQPVVCKPALPPTD